MGAKTIQAHVTELPTSISLKPGLSAEELDALTAYAEFLDITRLPYMRPHHQSMELSEPSRYDDLLGHIYLHGAVKQRKDGASVELQDAAADWYDNVYRPAITLIRKYDLMQYLPRRTEGDLYLWMVEHLRDVKEAYGEAGSSSFSHALVDFLQSRSIDVPRDLYQEQDPSVTLVRAQVEQQLREYRERLERESAPPAPIPVTSNGSRRED